ncbi:invasion associated locus B family protein [Rhizobium binxianense]
MNHQSEQPPGEKGKIMLMLLRNPPVMAGVVLLMLASGLAPAVAQDTQTQTTQRNPRASPPAVPTWALNCFSADASSGALECQMSRTILRQETGQILTVITIRKLQDGSMTMNLVLPHGLYLPAGVSYQIDTSAKNTAVILSSDQNGAYANVALTPELVSALKSGSTFNLGLETVSRSPLTIPVSLTGFTSAIDRLANLK